MKTFSAACILAVAASAAKLEQINNNQGFLDDDDFVLVNGQLVPVDDIVVDNQGNVFIVDDFDDRFSDGRNDFDDRFSDGRNDFDDRFSDGRNDFDDRFSDSGRFRGDFDDDRISSSDVRQGGVLLDDDFDRISSSDLRGVGIRDDESLGGWENGSTPLDHVEDHVEHAEEAEDENVAPIVLTKEALTAEVIKEINDGFDEIEKQNEEVVAEAIADTQEEAKEEIEAIVDEAHEEAVEMLTGEDAAEHTVADLAEVYEEKGEEINEAVQTHDRIVAKIAKKKADSKISNEDIKKNILFDILHTEAEGGDVQGVVENAHLPFAVNAFEHFGNNLGAAPGEKLNRILCRNGDCSPETVKADPEFDSFLNQVLANFAGTRDQTRSTNSGTK